MTPEQYKNLKVGDALTLTHKDEFITAGFGDPFRTEIIEAVNMLVTEIPSQTTVRIKRLDGKATKAPEGTWNWNKDHILKYMDIINIPIEGMDSNFNVSDIIAPNSIEDLLLAGHSTEFMLDARESNFKVFGLDLSGQISLMRADGKQNRTKTNIYHTKTTMINDCFKLVEPSKISKQNRLNLIDK